jgi:hypothetical protein
MKCWWGWCKSREKIEYKIMGDNFEKNRGGKRVGVKM